LDTEEPWVLEPFQEKFAADLFSGFPECWLIVPEGNTKTTTLGGLALYHCEHKTSAFVPVAASAREQAEWTYRQAEGFILRTPRLEGLFKPQEGYRRIKYKPDGSRIQVFAADDRTGDGVIPTFALLDELHRHRDLRLYRTWRGKLLKRNGQLATISTAGEPGGEFEETRDRIRQTAAELERDNTFVRAVSGTVVMHEYAVPEDGDVEDMDLVKAANPFSGVTVAALREKRDSPTMTIQHWRRFVCNLPTRSEFAAISEKEWFDAEVEDEIPPGEPVAVGIDLGWKWDTTAIVPLWLRDQQFRLFGHPKILVPPRDGTTTPGWKVEQALLELHERNPIRMVVMDMSAGGVPVAEWIEENIRPDEIIDRGQQNKDAAEDYHSFTDALREGWLKHSGDAEMNRHVLNAIARVLPQGDARFERPVQTRNSSEQDRRVIDALVAAAMVHCVAAQRWGTGDAVFDWQAVAPA
jgi:phage terminase large subunit-like protein